MKLHGFFIVYWILFSGHPGISVNKLSPLSLRRWNIRHFTFDFHRLKMADSWFLEEVTSPRKRELIKYTIAQNVSKKNTFKTLCICQKVAGQIGPKPNRSQVKSAPDQIIVLLWSFFIVSLLFFTPGNHMSANFVVYYCQHTKLNISQIVWSLFSKIFKYIQYVLIIEELKLSSKYSCVLYQ